MSQSQIALLIADVQILSGVYAVSNITITGLVSIIIGLFTYLLFFIKK